MDRTTIAELIRRCSAGAEFDIEQRAATFIARGQFKNLDASRLADCLGSLDLGAWQVDRSTLVIEGLDCLLLLIAEHACRRVSRRWVGTSRLTD
jgi:hypothetical protein